MDLIERIKNRLKKKKRQFDKPLPGITNSLESTAKKELEKRTINIGIDFGTNSTKVVYQIIELAGPDSKNAFVFDFNTGLIEYPPYTYPSLVTINQGKLYFGEEAFQKIGSAEAKFSSFKMCVACYRKFIPCKNCQIIGSSDFINGEYIYDDLNINAYEIAIYYLAYVMKLVYTECVKKYKEQYELTFFYNASFPLNYVEEPKKRRFFEWLVFHAEDLKDQIQQGVSIQEAKKLLDRSCQTNKKLPVDESRKTFCVAETRAAMHSIIESGYYDDGLYAIIDIGAGTSDISFFRNGKNVIGENKFSFYADQSHNLGGDDFDWIILASVKNKLKFKKLNDLELIKLIRNAKHQMSELHEFNLKEHAIVLSIDSVYNICIGNFNRLRTHFEETLTKAFNKEKKWSRWENINIILIGGGSKFSNIEQPLTSLNIHQLKNWAPNFRELRMAANIDYTDLNEYEFERNYHYFYTAHGLSYFIDDITESKFPDQVKDFRPKKVYREFVDADDQYAGMPDRRIYK